jgi:hypothetical protein
VLGTAVGVLRAANGKSAGGQGTGKGLGADMGMSTGGGLVSFSALDEVSSQRRLQSQSTQVPNAQKPQAQDDTGGGVTMTAVERAIESLAALAGRSHIKEELVHGSFRCAPCVGELTSLELDARSTAAYGVAHILSCLTVTNIELRALALAEKDITPEQFEQVYPYL